MVCTPEQALDSKFRSRATGNYTISVSSTDRVPPKALAVAQAEREGGLNDLVELKNIL